MEKENQRVRLTRMLLKEKLQELLKEKPVGRISVKELCEASGINRSTFYQHYPDVYALLEEIESDILRQTDEFITQINPEKSGQQSLVAFMAYVRENSAVLFTLLNPQTGGTFEKQFMALVLKRLGTSEPSILSSALLPYFSQFLIAGNISVIREWIANGFELSDEKIADKIYRLSENLVLSFGAIK